MSSPAFYKDLVDAIYHGDARMLGASDTPRSFDEKVTLTGAIVVNGAKLPANTTLRIQRPVGVH